MKRNILNMLAVFVLLLACTVGFVACGKKAETPAQLKPEDFVGEWYAESAVLSEEGEEDKSFTFAQFEELHEEYTEHYDTMDESDRYMYEDLKAQVFLTVNVTEDGEVQYKEYHQAASVYEAAHHTIGTWAITNNQLDVQITPGTLAANCSAEYKNGKIVITATGADYTTVLVFAKLAA